MRRRLLAAVLLTCSLTLTAASCGQQRVATSIAPPADKLVCAPAPPRPQISPEYQVDWSRISTVAQAKAAHDNYVATIRGREGIISGYILDIEGRLFACSNNAAWLRDFYSRLNK